ncbi:MAG TPA: Fe-Mn family superoxide dismutase [Candidatus Paceibacterota bacterium]
MNKNFEEKKFDIPKLKGISEKTMEEHLKLYAAYVKNVNELMQSEASEYNRRLNFEFGGMRNHEIYFSHFENGPKPFDNAGPVKTIDIEAFKSMALTRGVGWAMIGYDNKSERFIQYWVDEQHLGHLTGVSPILALDMWEHSYVADYQPSGKKQYVEDFFENLNWKSVEENLKAAE